MAGSSREGWWRDMLVSDEAQATRLNMLSGSAGPRTVIFGALADEFAITNPTTGN